MKYKIQGKILGKNFTTSFWSSSDNLDEVIHEASYRYAKGNRSCDCDKLALIGEDTEDTLCGDDYKYEELFLLTQEGESIDLLKEGWFLDDH